MKWLKEWSGQPASKKPVVSTEGFFGFGNKEKTSDESTIYGWRSKYIGNGKLADKLTIRGGDITVGKDDGTFFYRKDKLISNVEKEFRADYAQLVTLFNTYKGRLHEFSKLNIDFSQKLDNVVDADYDRVRTAILSFKDRVAKFAPGESIADKFKEPTYQFLGDYTQPIRMSFRQKDRGLTFLIKRNVIRDVVAVLPETTLDELNKCAKLYVDLSELEDELGGLAEVSTGFGKYDSPIADHSELWEDAEVKKILDVMCSSGNGAQDQNGYLADTLKNMVSNLSLALCVYIRHAVKNTSMEDLREDLDVPIMKAIENRLQRLHARRTGEVSTEGFFDFFKKTMKTERSSWNGELRFTPEMKDFLTNKASNAEWLKKNFKADKAVSLPESCRRQLLFFGSYENPVAYLDKITKLAVDAYNKGKPEYIRFAKELDTAEKEIEAFYMKQNPKDEVAVNKFALGVIAKLKPPTIDWQKLPLTLMARKANKLDISNIPLPQLTIENIIAIGTKIPSVIEQVHALEGALPSIGGHFDEKFWGNNGHYEGEDIRTGAVGRMFYYQGTPDNISMATKWGLMDMNAVCMAYLDWIGQATGAFKGHTVSKEGFFDGLKTPTPEKKEKKVYEPMKIDENNPPPIAEMWKRYTDTVKLLDPEAYKLLMEKLTPVSEQDINKFQTDTKYAIPPDIKTYLRINDGEINDFRIRLNGRFPLYLLESFQMFSLKKIAGEIHNWNSNQDPRDPRLKAYFPFAGHDAVVLAIGKGGVVKIEHDDPDHVQVLATSFKAYFAKEVEFGIEELYRYQ